MFHAAFVFHHSRDSGLYRVAYQLVRKAAYNRWLVSQGESQKHGTLENVGISAE